MIIYYPPLSFDRWGNPKNDPINKRYQSENRKTSAFSQWRFTVYHIESWYITHASHDLIPSAAPHSVRQMDGSATQTSARAAACNSIAPKGPAATRIRKKKVVKFKWISLSSKPPFGCFIEIFKVLGVQSKLKWYELYDVICIHIVVFYNWTLERDEFVNLTSKIWANELSKTQRSGWNRICFASVNMFAEFRGPEIFIFSTWRYLSFHHGCSSLFRNSIKQPWQNEFLRNQKDFPWFQSIQTQRHSWQHSHLTHPPKKAAIYQP